MADGDDKNLNPPAGPPPADLNEAGLSQVATTTVSSSPSFDPDNPTAFDTDATVTRRELQGELNRQGIEALLDADDAAKGVEDSVSESVRSDPAKMAARIRFAEQCYLISHGVDLALAHQQSLKPQVVQVEARASVQKPEFSYRKTHLINGRTSEIISKLKMRPGTESLLDIETSTLANLVPKLNLYKVVYGDEGDVECEIPFKFYNHTITREQASKDWSPDTLQQLPPGQQGPQNMIADTSIFDPRTGGGPQGRMGVGVKSFDWAYISTNPDTIRNDITAKLVLYFQSMDELLRKRQTLVTIASDPDVGDQYREYSYLDLIVAPPRKSASADLESDVSDHIDCGSTQSEYDSSEYEIKALVGWSNYAGMPNDLASTIGFNQAPIFLTLVDHDFSIGQDGTFQLTINYRGRLEGILSSPKSNVLLSGGGLGGQDNDGIFEQYMEIQKDIDELKKKQTCESDSIKEDIKVLKDKLIDMGDVLRTRSYELMLKSLLEPSNTYPELSGKRLIYTIPITLKDVIDYTNRTPPEPLSDSRQTRPLQEADVSLSGLQGLIRSDATQRLVEYANSLESFMPEILGGKGPPEISDFAPDSEYLSDLSNFSIVNDWDPANPTTNLINFFFLGDLIDILATSVFNNTKDKEVYGEGEEFKRKYAFNKGEVENLRVLLGPLEYIDPQTELTVRINIADIPISCRMFIDFFHRKVIKRRKKTYNFIEFVRDIVTDLAVRALGADCYGGAVRQKVQIRTAFVEGPATDDNRDPIVSQASTQSLEASEEVTTSGMTAMLDLNKFGYNNPIFKSESYGTKSLKNHYQYIVIYSQGPAGLIYPDINLSYLGDGTAGPLPAGSAPKLDRQRGIHHLNIGRDRGILRRVQFAKTDAPALREARVETAGNFDPIQQLSNVYELDIEMMGNTLFYPGSYLYLNPFGLGWEGKLGMPHKRGSISNIMGLGGYHIVTNVESFIESGKFHTKVKARFDSNGDGCRKTSAAEDNLSDCPEEPAIPISGQ